MRLFLATVCDRGGCVGRREKRTIQVFAKLGTQDTKAAWCVTETLRRLLRGQALHEVGAQGFVLTVGRILWDKKSLLFVC